MEPETVQIDFEWARNLEHPPRRIQFLRVVPDTRQAGTGRRCERVRVQDFPELGAIGWCDENECLSCDMATER